MASAAAVAARLSRQRFLAREGTYSGTYIQRQHDRGLTQRVVHHPAAEPLPPVAMTPERVLPGMEIRLVPLSKFEGGGSNSPEAQQECGICLAAFVAGDPCRIPACGHIFHARCLRQWFSAGNSAS